MKNAPNSAQSGVPDDFVGPMAYRRCTSCSETKPLLSFSVHSASKFRRNPVCKVCNTARSSEYFYAHRAEISVKSKVYRQENAEQLKKSKAEYFQRHREAIVANRRAQREAEPDRWHAYWASYYAHTKDRPGYQEYRAAYNATPEARARKLSQNRETRYADPAKAAEYQRQYRAANADKVRQLNADRYAKDVCDPSSRLSQARTARTRHIGSDGFMSWSEFRGVLRIARDMSAQTGIPHVVDHIYPLVSDRVCGLNTPANLRVVPKEVNTGKYNKLLASLSHEHFATEPWEVYDDAQ